MAVSGLTLYKMEPLIRKDELQYYTMTVIPLSSIPVRRKLAFILLTQLQPLQ